MSLADEQPPWSTLFVVCLIGPISGAVLGACTNAVNGLVSPDYFAIVMSWDWADAFQRAVLQGAIQGASLGLMVSFFFAVTIAASTKMRCPPWLAMRGLAMAIVTALMFWLAGGFVGTMLARVHPALWGFFFVGVPSRVNLPRFAWVYGSIGGVYAGAVIGLAVAGAWLHQVWKKIREPLHAFAVMQRAQGS